MAEVLKRVWRCFACGSDNDVVHYRGLNYCRACRRKMLTAKK